jgi:hypothetical protein
MAAATPPGCSKARCPRSQWPDAALTIPVPPLPVSARPQQARPPRRADPAGAHGILGRANAETGRLIARLTGLTHAGVTALNRITGVKKISEATVEQLQRRPDKADTWLR